MLLDRAAQLATAREAIDAAGFVARQRGWPIAQVVAGGPAALEYEVAVILADAARREARRRFDEREGAPEAPSSTVGLTDIYAAAVVRCYTHHEAERRRQAAESQAAAREVMPR